MDCHARALHALASGDAAQLEVLAREWDHFPHGEDPFIGDRWITSAIDVGSKSAVRWMLDRGVALDFTDDQGHSPLHSAIDREGPDRLEILEMLLAAGAPADRKGLNDWTPAHLAAARDDVDALRLLVRYGADLTIRTAIDDYATPLEEARSLGCLAAAEYLARLASASPRGA